MNRVCAELLNLLTTRFHLILERSVSEPEIIAQPVQPMDHQMQFHALQRIILILQLFRMFRGRRVQQRVQVVFPFLSNLVPEMHVRLAVWFLLIT
jgi:hypothetical protein